MRLLRREIDPLYDSFPVLETERLALRRLAVEDAPDVFDILSHPDVARFTARKPFQRVQDAIDLLRRVGLDYATRAAVRWGIVWQGESRIIGTVGLHDWDRYHRHIGIGFDLRRDQWGQGVGREAVKAVCAYAFDHLCVHRVEAHVMKGNQGSQRLLEDVGFEQEGVLRRRLYKDGMQHDVKLLALVRNGPFDPIH